MSLGPDVLLSQTYCIAEVSKNLDGQMVVLNATQRSCRRPGCEPLTLVQELRLSLKTHTCDSALGLVLDGSVGVRDLTTVFTGPKEHLRGVHAGRFSWAPSGGGRIVGTIQGITNAGIIRPPAFGQCETCDQGGVLTGHLFGTGNNVPSIPVPDFHVEAVYRLAWDPSATPRSTAPVIGTIEGVLILPCR